jgi:HEAT repeat protein
MPVRDLVEQLRDEDPEVRSQAVEYLRLIATSEAAGALVLVLNDLEPGIRSRAAAALGSIGGDAVEPVINYLRTWDTPLDPSIPELLGRLRTPRALPILHAHIGDRDPEARAAIARALGTIGNREGIPDLLELLRDLSVKVRIAAAQALGMIADRDTVDALLDELGDDDPAMRIAVAEALSRIGGRSAADAVARLVAEDPSPDVRHVAEVCLRRIGTTTIDPLVRLLTSGDLDDRIRAMTSLLEEGRAAVLPLKELTRHETPEVRAAAAEILGIIGEPGSVDCLVEASHDKDTNVRIAVATALGRIRYPRAADAVAPVLEDHDPKVAGAAANALAALGELSIDPLIRLLSSERDETRIRTTDVLGRLRHKGACERLIDNLTDPTPWVRIVSCQALGEIGENRAVDPLIEALKDRDAIVRAMAVEALGKLCDHRSTMPILARLKDRSDLVCNNALVALGRIGNPVALPFLSAALDDEDPDRRIAAIEGLVAIRGIDSIPLLRRMARPWPMSRLPRKVRDAARWGLEALESIRREQETVPPQA